MGQLTEEIEQLLQEPTQGTAFGMTAWAEGAEGILRSASEMDDATYKAEERKLIYAMLEGQRKAIERLAEEIERRS
jgi:hypothetical protein